MQQKFKAVFRSSSRKTSPPDQANSGSNASSPRSPRDSRQATSLDEQRSRPSRELHTGGVQHSTRSRPLSSACDPRRSSNASAQNSAGSDYPQNHSSDRASDLIASDYKAYLPVLSPVDDIQGEQYMTLGGDRRLINGESDGKHEEGVADRNIERYTTPLHVSKRKPLPATPGVNAEDQERPHKHSTDGRSYSPSTDSFRSAVNGTTPTRGGLVDSIQPNTEATAHEKNDWKRSEWPTRSAREESHLGGSRRRSRRSESDEDAPLSPPHNLTSRHVSETGPQNSTGTAVHGQDKIEKEIEQLLDGVVDLRMTVDEDKHVRWAPAVTHEVVKPHEHEIIQHKIYREIHNYEYYHRIQPVYDIEVLPLRHWIPNPDGEGLIEISADELPRRTGNNRRWKIVHEEIEPLAETRPVWRTEPEMIEHPTYVTEEGFERKETTIIHPPTLQDMSEYDGLVQPVHFDHKTGERWLGEITTMRRLQEGNGVVSDSDLMSRGGGENVAEAEVPRSRQSRELKRKPMTSPVAARLGEHSGEKGIAL